MSHTLSTVYPPPVRGRTSLAALVPVLVVFDLVGLAVAAPSIAADLQPSSASLAWVLAAGPLALAAVFGFARRVERFGRGAPIGAVLFTAAALFGVFAGTGEMLVVARLAQGVGAALMLTAAPPIRTRGSLVALVAGTVGAGALVSWFGWQALFVVGGLVALASLGGARAATEVRTRSVGANHLMLAGAAALLVAALVEVSERVQLLGQSPLRVGVLVVPAALCLAVPLEALAARVLGPKTAGHSAFATAALGFWMLAEASGVDDFVTLLVPGLAVVVLSLGVFLHAGSGNTDTDVVALCLGAALGVAVTTVDDPYLVAVLAAFSLSVVPFFVRRSAVVS